MVRVLHVAPVAFNPPFGSSVYVVSLLDAVAKLEGVQVGLLTHTPNACLIDMDKKVVLLPLVVSQHLNPWKINVKYVDSIF